MADFVDSIVQTRSAEAVPVLTCAEIERLRRFGELRSSGSGEPLGLAGETGDGLIIILSGQVDITEHHETGGARHIVTHGPGAFMGEIAQLSGRPALVDAYAQGPVVALPIAP